MTKNGRPASASHMVRAESDSMEWPAGSGAQRSAGRHLKRKGSGLDMAYAMSVDTASSVLSCILWPHRVPVDSGEEARKS